jgi:Yip1 domain
MASSEMPSALPTPEPVGSDNAFTRLIGTFIAPKKTFASIVARPTWFLPLVIMAVLGTILIGYFTNHVGWRYQIDRQIADNARAQKALEQLSPEEREQRLQTQAKVSGYFGYGFATIGVFIIACIVAGVLLLVFMIVAGEHPTYKQALGIVSHAWLPGIITALLGILVISLKDPSTIDINNLVATGASAYLPDGSAPWLKVLLSVFDIFTFWKIALMSIGFTAVDPKKMSFGKAFAIIFATYFIVMAGFAGVAAAFS